MLHLLSFLVSVLLFVGLGALILRELRGEADRIVAALRRAPVPAAARLWPVRVRLVSAPRPIVKPVCSRATA